MLSKDGARVHWHLIISIIVCFDHNVLHRPRQHPHTKKLICYNVHLDFWLETWTLHLGVGMMGGGEGGEWLVLGVDMCFNPQLCPA